MNTTDAWPAGATWVFQGTVAEDATVGTHVSSLTVTPGAGQEVQLLYGKVLTGNTATAQTVLVKIDDGTNIVTELVNAQDAAVNTNKSFPYSGSTATGTLVLGAGGGGFGPIISGTMRLILQVTTTAVSVTQTFSAVCRIKTSALPTATLADTVGTPTLTTNTNKVF